MNAFSTPDGMKPLEIGPIAGRLWQLLFPAGIKCKSDHQEIVFFAVSGLGIPSTDTTDADKVRRLHYSLLQQPIDLLKYLMRMKLAQSRTHAVSLRLGPSTAFSTDFDHQPLGAHDGDFDVLIQQVPCIVLNMIKSNGGSKEIDFTDGAGLISKALMHKIIQDYKRHNPKARVAPNICAFQGRVGPNKGVWVVWPDHLLMERMGRHPGSDMTPNQDVLLFRQSQRKWRMQECRDAQIEVSWVGVGVCVCGGGNDRKECVWMR